MGFLLCAVGCQNIAVRKSDFTNRSNSLCFFLEIFLAYAAKRTFPIVGKISESSAGLDAVIRIACSFVIDITAYCANKFCHSFTLFLPLVC